MFSTVFHRFNPETSGVFGVAPALFWGGLSLPLLVTKPSLWVRPRRVSTLKSVLLSPVLSLVKNQQRRGMPLVPPLLSSVFLFLLVVNLRGLIPYAFPYTTQVYVTLTLTATFWLPLFLLSLRASPRQYMASLTPKGMPAVLAPFVAVLEGLTLLVRPLTLTLRLIVNLFAGHILLGLLRSVAAGMALVPGLPLVVGGVVSGLIFLLELLVAGVQRYVYVLLLVLYAQEHMPVTGKGGRKGRA